MRRFADTSDTRSRTIKFTLIAIALLPVALAGTARHLDRPPGSLAWSSDGKQTRE